VISIVFVFFGTPCIRLYNTIRHYTIIHKAMQHYTTLYNVIQNYTALYTGCIKKKIIELQRAIVSELLYVWTRFFHIRKDHAFSCWMISSSLQMDKKWANTNPIKNVSQNRKFSPLRVGSKTIENEPPLGLKLMNFTSLNCTNIHNYY
jgi:hypothetical protein